MLRVDGVWHMFFEVMNDSTTNGDIGLAISRNGFDWQYQKIVLTEPFHLSYPYVFQWNDDIYMIPETIDAKAVRIYRAKSFPDQWTLVKDLIPGAHADPTIFQFQDKWWMFTCPNPYQHDTLSLFYASDPLSAWTPHPRNPLISGDRRIARPGGRVLHNDGSLIRLTQDCYPIYGRQLRAFQVTELATDSYQEHEVPESPILTPSGNGWNSSGMHHADVHRLDDSSWIACVDGLWSSEKPEQIPTADQR